MDMKKISLDIEKDTYLKLKMEALQRETTMVHILRGMLIEKFGGQNG
jgi:hypothetical protein